jgi:hypothetical protein
MKIHAPLAKEVAEFDNQNVFMIFKPLFHIAHNCCEETSSREEKFALFFGELKFRNEKPLSFTSNC